MVFQHDPRHVDVLVKGRGLGHGNFVRGLGAPESSAAWDAPHQLALVQPRSTGKVCGKSRWWPGQHVLPLKPTIRSVAAADSFQLVVAGSKCSC